MGWLIFEALAAGGLLVFIVWWTMFSGRRGGERHDDDGPDRPSSDRRRGLARRPAKAQRRAAPTPAHRGVKRLRSRTRNPRDASATRKASVKLTPRFNKPITGTDARHHQKAGSATDPARSAPTRAASWPIDSVTWRTSIGRPKKAHSTGTKPSIEPSDTLRRQAGECCRHQRAQRCARSWPPAGRGCAGSRRSRCPADGRRTSSRPSPRSGWR
jgi:hypothetical protein